MKTEIGWWHPLWVLRHFFQSRDQHGTYMGVNEDAINASQRRLSCWTDGELYRLRDGTEQLIKLIDGELTARDDEEDLP